MPTSMRTPVPNKPLKRKRAAATSATTAMAPAKAIALPTVALNSNCTVKDAVALKQALCAVVDINEAVTLDASSVERVDTAILQLLCAFVRARTASNRSVIWRGEASGLFDSARLLGLQALLALPQHCAGGAQA
jgi:ABC-type transporter Mla MlaB component